jgi:hypothetical protein
VEFDRGQRIANPPFDDGADQVDVVALTITGALHAFSRVRQARPGFVTAAIHAMCQATQDVGQRESRVVRQRFLRGLEHTGKGMQIAVDGTVIRMHRGRGRAEDVVAERVLHEDLHPNDAAPIAWLRPRN